MALKPLSPSRDDWRVINALDKRVAQDRSESSAHLHNLLPRLRRPEDSRGNWHPFKLYPVYSSPWDPENDWLRFRVRAGRVLESDAIGTDASNADPDAEELQAADTSDYITITEGIAAFWFWLELSSGAGGSTTATVRYSDSPATNGWSTCPKPDASHIPIGWIDTLTYKTEKRVVIRQLLKTDVIQVGSSSIIYRGTYLANTSYNVGDIVRVRSGSHQGVYICVQACLAEDDPQHVPTYPEPADSAGVNYWEILALGIRQLNICMDGTPTTANVNTDAAL